MPSGNLDCFAKFFKLSLGTKLKRWLKSEAINRTEILKICLTCWQFGTLLRRTHGWWADGENAGLSLCTAKKEHFYIHIKNGYHIKIRWLHGKAQRAKARRRILRHSYLESKRTRRLHNGIEGGRVLQFRPFELDLLAWTLLLSWP